jgi:5'-AMP-activated protein kinase regulatory beta subunit
MKRTIRSSGKKVTFRVVAAPGSEVFVAGTFNDWNPKEHALHDNPDSGHYAGTLVVPTGRHEYKFIINGDWRVDPNSSEWVPNGQGSLNSVIKM